MTTMTGEAFFIGLAQISLGFAGFSSLIIALLGPLGRPWGLIETNALRLILEHSLFLVFLCLFPFVLRYVPIDEAMIWRSTSFLLAAFSVLEYRIQRRRVVEAGEQGVFPQPTLRWCFFPPTAGFAILEILNALFWAKLWVLCFGLLHLLFQPARQFFVRLNRYFGEMHGSGDAK